MRNPWFSFYPADYLADTGHLTQAQHGAYLLLMLHYYATGGPIPANAMQVHAICRCTNDAERHAANTVLQLFFTREEDFYRNTRIDAEIAKRSALRTKRQNAAQERWGEKVMQVHMQVHTQSQSHIDTHSNKKVLRPSLEEVKAYCLERKNGVDPQQWLDHYSANGWKVGRSAMKDWRAAVRTWEKNGFSKASKQDTLNEFLRRNGALDGSETTTR